MTTSKVITMLVPSLLPDSLHRQLQKMVDALNISMPCTFLKFASLSLSLSLSVVILRSTGCHILEYFFSVQYMYSPLSKARTQYFTVPGLMGKQMGRM